MTLILISKDGFDDIYIDSAALADHIRLGWKLAEIEYGKQNISMPDGSVLTVGGDVTLTDTTWDDLRFRAAGINPPGAASDPTRDTSDGRLTFSATASNIIAIQAQMPHSWKEGSAIRPHVHWSPTNTNTGHVKWQMQYKIANVDEAFPGSWTTVTALDAGSGTSDMHQIAGLGEIDMTGKTLSCMILLLITRLGADVQDTYNADCKLNEVDIHYEMDTLGSDQEYTKE